MYSRKPPGSAGCSTRRQPTRNPIPRAERALAADLDRIFGAPVMEQGLWGVEVQSLDSGRVLYARNPRKLMMPASNMKILTLAAAAETLGWDYRFKTTLESDADDRRAASSKAIWSSAAAAIRRSTAAATAPRRVFDEWAAAIKAAGITRIDGNIVADASAFDGARARAGLVVGLPGGRICRAVERARVQREHRDADRSARARRPATRATLELPPSTGLGLLHHVVTGDAGIADDDRYRARARQQQSGRHAARSPPTRSPRRARWRSPTRRSISLTG